jgi:hypothetical protein
MRALHRADSGQQRAHEPRLFRFISRLTRDLGFRATRGLHSSAGRARCRRRAFHNRAARARAGRAITDLTGLVTGGDTRRAGRHGRLQNISGHVWRRRTLRLEHVAGQIGLGRARRYTGLQHILGPVHLRAAIAIVGVIIVVSTSGAATIALAAPTLTAIIARPAARGTCALRDIYEAL